MDQASTASPSANLAFTLVADEQSDMATTQDLRAALEKGTDDLKLDTLRRIIISTLNGSPHVNSFLFFSS
jgi:coatomer subunit beta